MDPVISETFEFSLHSLSLEARTLKPSHDYSRKSLPTSAREFSFAVASLATCGDQLFD